MMSHSSTLRVAAQDDCARNQDRLAARFSAALRSTPDRQACLSSALTTD
jgi:hypothetical protein